MLPCYHFVWQNHIYYPMCSCLYHGFCICLVVSDYDLRHWWIFLARCGLAIKELHVQLPFVMTIYAAKSKILFYALAVSILTNNLLFFISITKIFCFGCLLGICHLSYLWTSQWILVKIIILVILFFHKKIHAHHGYWKIKKHIYRSY